MGCLCGSPIEKILMYLKEFRYQKCIIPSLNVSLNLLEISKIIYVVDTKVKKWRRVDRNAALYGSVQAFSLKFQTCLSGP
jgi:hypothetical protein